MREEQSIESIEKSSEGNKFSLGKLLSIIIGIGLVLGVIYFLFVGNGQVDDFTDDFVVTEVDENIEKSVDDNPEGDLYTLDEVAPHATADDCWIVIHGSLYDVTEFIADQAHPGGAAILEGCGIDATEFYETRPMGSGTPHSSNARALLGEFYIGEIGSATGDLDDDLGEEGQDDFGFEEVSM